MADKIYGAEFSDETNPTGSETISINNGTVLKDARLDNILARVAKNATAKSIEDTDTIGYHGETSSALRSTTWSSIKATLKTYLDTLYATAAKGVTNGDSHNHNGGDGAAIDHNNVLNIGSNSHSTIDAHLAASAPHSGHVNKTSAGRPGVTKLYRREDDSGYSVQTYWTGSLWRLFGYDPSDNPHADTYVGWADNAVSAGVSGTWTPTIGGLTVGNGTISATYVTIGKLELGSIIFTFGTTTSVVGDVNFSFRTTISAIGNINVQLFDTAIQVYNGVGDNTTTAVYARAMQKHAANNNIVAANLSSTVPFTWGSGDRIQVQFWAILP